MLQCVYILRDMKHILIVTLLIPAIYAQEKEPANQREMIWLHGLSRLFIGIPELLIDSAKKIGVKGKYEKYFPTQDLPELARLESFEEAGHLSCEQVCPTDYRILTQSQVFPNSHLQLKQIPVSFNPGIMDPLELFAPGVKPVFNNDEEDFKDIHPRVWGYCWGYSSLVRKMFYLANFQEKLDHEQAQLIQSYHQKYGHEDYLEQFYKAKIRSIRNMQFTTIP